MKKHASRPRDELASKSKQDAEKGVSFRTNLQECSIHTVSVPSPGATVWAHFYNFLGAFKEDPSSGWSHTLKSVHSIDEVVAGLERAGLRREVAHLALVGHNEAAWAGLKPQGNVTFDPPIPGSDPVPARGLAPEHLAARPTPVGEFGKLSPYLRQDAWLSLYICNSAAGKEGDELLKAISNVLPGRTIVGFTVFVMVGNAGDTALPGNACGTTSELDLKSDPQLSPLTPWGKAAKRAQNGAIVHVPWLEKKGTDTLVKNKNGYYHPVEGPPFRCGNPCCPTHSSKDHDCKGW